MGAEEAPEFNPSSVPPRDYSDRLLVYNFLLGRFLPGIIKRLGPLQGDPDVAYQLGTDASAEEWIGKGVRLWSQWRNRSMAKLRPEISHVVAADIAGFYDNVDFARIQDNLRRLEAPVDELRVLATCLNRWSHPRGKGIPQGYSASDILAKAYLWSFDERLRRMGYEHLRYVDDIRLFCASPHHAKHAIRDISALLHAHGLTLQSAKTEILKATEARAKFDGVQPTIRRIQKALAEEVRSELGLVGGYMPSGVLISILDSRGSEIHPEVLERTFTDNFGSAVVGAFDKTLFHYLLTRLGACPSNDSGATCFTRVA